MKVDVFLPKDISATKHNAVSLVRAGYDGIWIGETKHDPFLQSVQVAEVTEHVTIGTSVAIAFARSPMTIANTAYDLARYAAGRFVLGLGSQVKPHIERRFSMPWSQPAARMRELVLALRAIWACWQDGSPLDFHGSFYRHTLMTPFFAPEAHPFGPPPVYLAAVGERMTQVAGEVCDGLFFHPFTTQRYLREVTLPAVEKGRAAAGRTMEDFVLCGPAFVAVGRDDKELRSAIAGTKAQIAFYASTPAYRPVLDLHGWGDLQTELTTMTKQGRWAEMGRLVDDELLDAMAVVGSPAEVGAELHARYGQLASRLTLYATYDNDPEIWPAVLGSLGARSVAPNSRAERRSSGPPNSTSVRLDR